MLSAGFGWLYLYVHAFENSTPAFPTSSRYNKSKFVRDSITMNMKSGHDHTPHLKNGSPVPVLIHSSSEENCARSYTLLNSSNSSAVRGGYIVCRRAFRSVPRKNVSLLVDLSTDIGVTLSPDRLEVSLTYPTMIGTRANLPSANNLVGKSGISS